MNIKDTISKLLNKNMFLLKTRLLYEILKEYTNIIKYLGAVSLNKDKEKIEAKISIISHAIEKGLSLPNPKVGFGESKISNILEYLEIYQKQYSDNKFICRNVPILKAYFKFNHIAGHDNIDLYKRYKSIIKNLELSYYKGGIETIYKNDIIKYSNIDFDNFTKKRYSIRDFSSEPISINTINKALEIAKKSPSACNRQPWKVYVFKNTEIKDKLLKWQMGSRGFSSNIDTAIVVTCSLKKYFIGETHQAYVDGGLYSMTLIYALHSLGVGTIPLTLGLPSNKLKPLYNEFKINKDELPILVIGVGALKDKTKVAISDRIDISEYVTFYL